MKTLCLVLALLLVYTSVAYCVSWDEDKRPYIERFREIEAAYKQRFLDSQKKKKEAEMPSSKRAAEAKRKQEEAQRIQIAVDEQLSTNMKERLNYTEQIVNNLIY